MKTHKPDSLWTLLNNYIKERGQITYGELCQKVAEEGYKVETATRRLREMTDIEPVMGKSKRGTNYIKAYKYKPFRWTADDTATKDIILSMVEQGEAPKEEITTDYKALIQRTKLPIENRKDLQKGLFIYKVDPKHAISELRDPN